jgi:hypothetical protein
MGRRDDLMGDTKTPKEPIVLVDRDEPGKILAYACGVCGLVVSSPRRDGDQAERIAREHCGPSMCACGREVQRHRTACRECVAEHEAQRDRERFEKAEKLDPDTYTGPVWLDGYGAGIIQVCLNALPLAGRLRLKPVEAEKPARVYRICRTTNDAWVVESAGDGAWERESVHSTQGSARREMLRLEREENRDG